MKPSTKIILGFLTFLPALIVLLLIAFLSLTGIGTGQPDPHGITGLFFSAAFAVSALTALLSLGLTAFYIVHASRHRGLRGQTQSWGMLLLFFGIIAQPVYWYMYIWREPAPLP